MTHAHNAHKQFRGSQRRVANTWSCRFVLSAWSSSCVFCVITRWSLKRSTTNTQKHNRALSHPRAQWKKGNKRATAHLAHTYKSINNHIQSTHTLTHSHTRPHTLSYAHKYSQTHSSKTNPWLFSVLRDKTCSSRDRVPMTVARRVAAWSALARSASTCSCI